MAVAVLPFELGSELKALLDGEPASISDVTTDIRYLFQAIEKRLRERERFGNFSDVDARDAEALRHRIAGFYA